MSTLLSIENVGYKYRNLSSLFSKKTTDWVLSDISFSLNRGDRLGILGVNGSGKSTLLKLIVGSIPPTNGSINFDSKISRMLLALGLGFDDFLSGRDNAMLGMMLQGIPRKTAMGKLKQVQDFADLGKYFNLPVRIYSNGMRSKLAFATAVMSDVDIMLIDEVISVGDESFREKAETTLLQKIDKQAATIFVSHNPWHIERICNRVIWLHEGKLRADSENVSSVLADYSNSFEKNS